MLGVRPCLDLCGFFFLDSTAEGIAELLLEEEWMNGVSGWVCASFMLEVVAKVVMYYSSEIGDVLGLPQLR